jgi:DNA-binding NarL/FixJ family response regulator
MNDQTDESKIRLILLVNHGLFRTSLARLLSSEAGFEVVGECGTCVEALEILSAAPIDVVVLDFNLGVKRADDFIRAAQAAGYQGRFLVVAETVDVESSASALRLGVSGIFLVSEAAGRLVQAIRVVATGAVWVDHRVIRLLAEKCLNKSSRHANHELGAMLKDQEQKVLLGILDGLTSKRIASRMGITEVCVKDIVQVLFAKAGVRKRSQLVRVALEGSLGNVQRP